MKTFMGFRSPSTSTATIFLYQVADRFLRTISCRFTGSSSSMPGPPPAAGSESGSKQTHRDSLSCVSWTSIFSSTAGSGQPSAGISEKLFPTCMLGAGVLGHDDERRLQLDVHGQTETLLGEILHAERRLSRRLSRGGAQSRFSPEPPGTPGTPLPASSASAEPEPGPEEPELLTTCVLASTLCVLLPSPMFSTRIFISTPRDHRIPWTQKQWSHSLNTEVPSGNKQWSHSLKTEVPSGNVGFPGLGPRDLSEPGGGHVSCDEQLDVDWLQDLNTHRDSLSCVSWTSIFSSTAGSGQPSAGISEKLFPTVIRPRSITSACWELEFLGHDDERRLQLDVHGQTETLLGEILHAERRLSRRLSRGGAQSRFSCLEVIHERLEHIQINQE
ncbi:hypothetical protein F7725_025733 [Dissostichus mawsoni]|uniref:Uncharacterized protein n=1 Tax=Dissostichus mawsoni TaxID=36200 RepID=A0A7J5X6G8_DISMA|nr:hypothetical protein F7725_025733 [Dissostichus mawsoni]